MHEPRGPIMIANALTSYNSLLSESSGQITNYFKLPRLHKQLLALYYDARLAGHEFADYSCLELALRFRRSRQYISTTLAELEAWGWLQSSPHGSRSKHRWITLGAFIILDNLPRHQTRHQNQDILYIDLSKREENKDYILKGELTCGKIESAPPSDCRQHPSFDLPLEQQMDKFLEKSKIGHKDRADIKKRFKQAQMGSQRKKSLMARVVYTLIKKPVLSVKSYVLGAIAKEEKREKWLERYLLSKNISYDLMAFT